MNFTKGLSKEGKKLLNTSTEDMETVKSKLSKEDLIKLEENCKREGMKAEKEIAKAQKEMAKLLASMKK